MRTVEDLYQASLKLDITYLVGLSLALSGDRYLEIQKEQMFDGEREDGTPIFNTKTGSEYYSPSYARYKGKDSPIDLKDTGAFYGGMFTRQESEGLLVDSDDHKSDMLKETYEPFLLNDDSKIEFMPFANQILIDEAVKELNGGV